MELVSQRLVPLDQAVSQLCCTCSCFQLVLSIFHKSFHSGAISTTRILYLGILTELHLTPSQHSKCHGIAIYPHFLQYLYMAELVKDQFIKLGCFAPVCNDADILNDKMINIRTRIRKVSTKILWNANISATTCLTTWIVWEFRVVSQELEDAINKMCVHWSAWTWWAEWSVSMPYDSNNQLVFTTLSWKGGASQSNELKKERRNFFLNSW